MLIVGNHHLFADAEYIFNAYFTLYKALIHNAL